jgi:serine/threonine protein kinase
MYVDYSNSFVRYITTGVVYRARDKVTKEIVALKRCLPHHEASDGFPLTTLREITLLRELQDEGRNNGIVIMKDVAVSSRCVIFGFISLEYIIENRFKQPSFLFNDT